MRKILVPAGWILLWLIGPLVFLLTENGSGISGFPLDDAWIHQTYARSLAGGLGWTYAGGPPTAGSTSPLWTILQIPSFWLHISPVAWSIGVGVMLLLANAVLIMLWIRNANPNASRFAFFFCLVEWHLVWAALSGMETILYCAWISMAVFLFFPMKPRWEGKKRNRTIFFALGLLAGMGIWIRPEAVLLSGMILLSVLLPWRRSPILQNGGFLLGWIFPILIYFLFTYRLNGHLLPNTFFVKTAEYSSLTSASLMLRVLKPWLPLLAGPLAVLILFVPSALASGIRNRNWGWCLPFIWALAHLGLYAVQLPATYQHGRYFLPILPVLIGYGVCGYFSLKKKWASLLPTRVVSRSLWASAILSAVLFICIGAVQYVRDVKIIDSEMVAVSIWIRENTPPDAVVAAHDVGALGFFGQRRIIDLGGVSDMSAMDLLSGEVSLQEYLRRKDADFLMTMPDFFPDDVAGCNPLPEFRGGISPDGSSRRTLVYAWRNGCTE